MNNELNFKEKIIISYHVTRVVVMFLMKTHLSLKNYTNTNSVYKVHCFNVMSATKLV